MTFGRRAIACRSVEVARRVIARFGLSVTQPGRFVAVLGSQAGHPPAGSRQLVGAGILAVLGGVGAIFGGHPAVVDSLGPVVSSLSVPRGSSGAFPGRLLTLARRAIAGGSVEITRGVVARRGLSVTLLGLSVADVRSPVAVAPLDVALAWRRQGVRALIRPVAVLIWERRAACLSFGHMSRFGCSRRPRARKVLQRRAFAITNAATCRVARDSYVSRSHRAEETTVGGPDAGSNHGSASPCVVFSHR